MTKPVRNIARLTITMLGGAVVVPIAWRRKDSTTTMRVKEVTVTRIAGAMDSTVIRTISCTMRLVVEPPSPRSRENCCAEAGRASISSPSVGSRRFTGWVLPAG